MEGEYERGLRGALIRQAMRLANRGRRMETEGSGRQCSCILRTGKAYGTGVLLDLRVIVDLRLPGRCREGSGREVTEHMRRRDLLREQQEEHQQQCNRAAHERGGDRLVCQLRIRTLP